jgi:hypothetical protein
LAGAALLPGFALWETLLKCFGGAAEWLRVQAVLLVGLTGLNGVLGAVVVLLLVTLVVLGLVTGVTAVVLPVAVVVVVRWRGWRRNAVVIMLGTALALVNIVLAVLLVVSWRLTVALYPNITVLLDVSGTSAFTLDVDVPVNMRGVGRVMDRSRSRDRSGSGRGLLVDFNVDVGFLLGVLMLGLVGFLDGLQGGQVAKDLAETLVGDAEFLLPVLELFLFAEEPVDAVPHANTAAIFNVASDAFRVGGNVFEGAAHVAHAAVDPFGFFRVGLEDVVDFADREQTAHLFEIRADAADDAHVDGIGWADVAHTFGLCKELCELVGAAEGRGRSAEGDELSLDHDGQTDGAWTRKLPATRRDGSME